MPENYPPYTPMPSLGHELGIMFGFIGICLATMAVYTLFWRAAQHRAQAQDLARRKAFHNRSAPFGTTDQLQLLGTTATVTAGRYADVHVHEKMLDRFGIPDDHVELPVHEGAAMQMQMQMLDWSRSRSRSQVQLVESAGPSPVAGGSVSSSPVQTLAQGQGPVIGGKAYQRLGQRDLL
ncbi:hypothetical protein NUU61_004321 [Penicillium alfredii]|uniref:Uncharacterized protein n=1 Tax=Penicillium alfredii TaxID=1506179 RepID=A0A9W9FKV7_9EURO|nr:uncharacterized protein NUU61_004321 [Penicillium alfredii]KAJ5102099.1 hypothetical protein NUU61_004321 [Penicillium alfredii]